MSRALALWHLCALATLLACAGAPPSRAATATNDSAPPPSAAPPPNAAEAAPPNLDAPSSSETCELASSTTADRTAPCGGESPVGFDRDAMRKALAALDFASCKKANGPIGRGSAKMTLYRTGRVRTVKVDEPFGGTPTGKCVAAKLKGVRVPAFDDDDLVVRVPFLIK